MYGRRKGDRPLKVVAPPDVAAEALFGAVAVPEAALRTQSRKASFAEACANTAIGFCVSWGATYAFLHLLDIRMSFHQLWWYTWGMTFVSIARSYALRRLWNAEWWKRRR